jgi:hypothetical protein
MNGCDDLGSLMIRRPPDTLQPQRACGSRYPFLIVMKSAFPPHRRGLCLLCRGLTMGA